MLRFVDLLVDLLRAKNVPKTYFGGNVQMPKICVSFWCLGATWSVVL